MDGDGKKRLQSLLAEASHRMDVARRKNNTRAYRDALKWREKVLKEYKMTQDQGKERKMSEYERWLEEKMNNIIGLYAEALRREKEYGLVAIDPSEVNAFDNMFERISAGMAISRLKGEFSAYEEALNEYRKVKGNEKLRTS